MHFYLFFPAETVSTSPARRLWASADQDTFQSFESYATPTGAAKGSIGAGSTTDAEDLTDEGAPTSWPEGSGPSCVRRDQRDEG